MTAESAAQEAAEAAGRRERERIARELHDGLAQDLAAIALHARLLSPVIGPDHPMARAARRALATTRATMTALAAPPDGSLEADLRQMADELGARLQLTVLVTVQDPPPAATDATPEAPPASERARVLREAGQAVVAAAVDGGATRVELTLVRPGGPVRVGVGTGAASGESRPGIIGRP